MTPILWILIGLIAGTILGILLLALLIIASRSDQRTNDL